MLFKMRNCYYRLVVLSSLSSVCYNASITSSSYHLSSSSMIYAVNVYVPVQSSPGVRSAIAQAKAGMIGNYDSCSFTSMGTGRFRPLEKARPSIGSVGVLEEVSEEKIEVVVEERFLAAVLAAVKEAHPYEEPAILVFPMLDYKRIIGRESNEDCVESTPTAVEHAADLDGYRSYYAVSVYVPVQSSPKVRSALAQAKAGMIGNYDSCSFTSMGTGRFRPLEKARPSIGSVGVLEEVSEEKIEVVVEERFLAAVLAAVKEAHPYEEPAIQVLHMLDYKRIIGLGANEF